MHGAKSERFKHAVKTGTLSTVERNLQVLDDVPARRDELDGCSMNMQYARRNVDKRQTCTGCRRSPCPLLSLELRTQPACDRLVDPVRQVGLVIEGAVRRYPACNKLLSRSAGVVKQVQTSRVEEPKNESRRVICIRERIADYLCNAAQTEATNLHVCGISERGVNYRAVIASM